MLIQAAADFHGKQQRYTAFREEAEHHSPHVAVLAGDVDDSPHFYRLLEQLSLPVLVVHGNMDHPGIRKRVEEKGGIFLHGTARTLGGLRFMGLGGGKPSSETVMEGQPHEEKRMADRDVDVLVTHVPPRGSLDKTMLGTHIGSPWVRRLVEQKKPRLVICGHVHEHPGHTTTGETVVVNCSVGRTGRCTLIDIDEKIQVRRLE
ncbi:MAG: metallophosphoesterase family protein [Candidatus Thermoplasmatota archaeon]|nr:metallophosphoesterase family protein [Candidatus Thermoplasmatota archaeon]